MTNKIIWETNEADLNFVILLKGEKEILASMDCYERQKDPATAATTRFFCTCYSYRSFPVASKQRAVIQADLVALTQS